jgi:hypothetical protein
MTLQYSCRSPHCGRQVTRIAPDLPTCCEDCCPACPLRELSGPKGAIPQRASRATVLCN